MLVKIMARFADGHPPALVDLVEEGHEIAAIERYREYLWDSLNNPEGYDSFYYEFI